MQRSSPQAAVGCWPDDRQRLLLAAAVSGDERAVEAWDRWRAKARLEDVNAADVPLLAAAYRPLRRLGVDAADPLLARARGIYRRSWYLNQLGLRRAAAVVAALRAAGIDVIVLKGAALALIHHRDLGARPMEDIDLLVVPGRLSAAVRSLEAHGWRELRTQGPNAGPLRYGTHVEDADENEVDLHEYALMQSVDDSDLWQTRIRFDLMGTPTSALAPAEQLLHVCAHGMRWDGATIRWALDAMAILHSSGEDLNWDRLVDRAQARRLTVAVGHALTWLRESLQADVPPWVLEHLRAGPRLRFERVVHLFSTRPPRRLGFVVMSFDRYRRFAKLAPLDERPRSFAHFLQTAWQLERSSQLLLHGSRKLAGRSRAMAP